MPDPGHLAALDQALADAEDGLNLNITLWKTSAKEHGEIEAMRQTIDALRRQDLGFEQLVTAYCMALRRLSREVGHDQQSDPTPVELMPAEVWAELYRAQEDGPALGPISTAKIIEHLGIYSNPVLCFAAVRRLLELEADLRATRRQRDLAIAHDQQPYPTADAYERACEALHKHRRRADAAEAQCNRYQAVVDAARQMAEGLRIPNHFTVAARHEARRVLLAALDALDKAAGDG